MQELALGLVEPHKVHRGPLLELVYVPLNGILSFWCVSYTTQLYVVCRLDEGALDLTVYVIDENITQHRSQYGPLRDITWHWYPLGHLAIDYYPLDATIQPTHNSLNSQPIKSVSPQFGEKDVVRDCVKGFTEVQIHHIHSSSLVH